MTTLRLRRTLLAAIGSLPFARAVAGVTAPARAANRAPPVARIESVQDELWGETIVDPYRWMENPRDPEFVSFMREQGAYARGTLDAIPGRAAMADRVARLSANAPTVRIVQPVGDRLFYEERPSGADNFKLYVRDRAGGDARLLVDPTQLSQNGVHTSLDWWQASPDARYVVYGLSVGGSENSVLHVQDVATGDILPERIDRTQYAGATWLPDSSGFFFNRLAEGARTGAVDYYKNSVAWLHRLRTDPGEDRKVFGRGLHADIPVAENEFPYVFTDPSIEHVIGKPQGGVRHENAYYVARRDDLIAGKPRWQKVCDVGDEIVLAAVYGDALYLLTTKGAPNGKVLRTSLSAPDLAKATLAVAESETVIQGMVAVRDGLYLQVLNGGYGGLRRLAPDAKLSTIRLPYEGSVLRIGFDTRQDGLWFIGTSWLLPETVFRCDAASGTAWNAGVSPRLDIDLSPYRAIRSFATARDGTRIPLSIVARKRAHRDGRNPALVSAYGSYQIVNAPRFDPRRIAFLEQGGVLATAHVRGGGEYGKRWWKAGQKRNKPNTWRDLVDCCEALVMEGWTAASRLAIEGGSAGGITVGRALTERPDLFAAVISNVGVSNALRAEFSQNGPPNIDEFGTVTTRDGFEALKAMDALHAVRDGVAYPAVLLTTGMTDPRVEPWQAAKMTARLQRATRSTNPILLRVTFDAGHGLGSTRTQQDDLVADVYAFVLWRAGHRGFQPHPG